MLDCLRIVNGMSWRSGCFFLRTLYEWMTTTDLFSFSNLLDFIDECNFSA
jgi:hypothetical protein